MTPADDRWPDDIIQLLRDHHRRPPEPTATEAAAYVGMKVAEYAAYLIIAISIVGFGVASGWLR